MKQVLFVAIAVLVLYGCNTGSDVITTESGLTINRLLKGDGEEVESRQILIMNLLIKNEEDSIIINTYEQGIPRPAAKVDSIWESNQGTIEEILYYLAKGDSVNCSLPANKIYKGIFPQGVNDQDFLNVTISIEDVVDKEEFAEYRKKMLIKVESKKKEEDIELIKNYLQENNIEANRTESGLYYIIHEGGQGELVLAGQKINAHYTGKVLGGDYFDSSVKEVAQEIGKYDERREPYQGFSFVVGKGQVIKGWDEGFQLLKKGSKATLYIPSGMAYGARARSEVIKAHSILVFDVEVLEITNE